MFATPCVPDASAFGSIERHDHCCMTDRSPDRNSSGIGTRWATAGQRVVIELLDRAR
jgi:hypothetical protein